jgi:hypothetical protein
MIRLAFMEENMSRAKVFEWHAPFRADQRRLLKKVSALEELVVWLVS